jgi:hypothetical protein
MTKKHGLRISDHLFQDQQVRIIDRQLMERLVMPFIYGKTDSVFTDDLIETNLLTRKERFHTNT